MRFLIVLTIILAYHPSELPKSYRVAERNAGVIQKESDSATSDQNDSKNSIETPSAQTANSDKDAAVADENIRIQGKLVLFTGLLVVVGFITAGVICWQSWESRKAAEAAKKGVALQKVAMQQWIDIDGLETIPVHLQPTATQFDLPISFQLGNPTKFPLVLHSLLLWIDRVHALTVLFGGIQLSPDDSYTMNTSTRLEGVKLARYRAGNHSFEMGGVISFVDAFKEPQTCRFGYICKCGSTKRGEFELCGFAPPDEAELSAQLRRQAQKEGQSPN